MMGGSTVAQALYTSEVQAAVERAKTAADVMAAASHSTGKRERKVPRWGPEHDAALSAAPCDPWPQSTSAHSICSRAAQIVAGDRAAQHGPKERAFENIAILWRAFMQLKRAEHPGHWTSEQLTAWDIATMMELLKIARRFAGAGRTNPDNYVDGAGYSGIAGEIALSEGEVRYGPSS